MQSYKLHNPSDKTVKMHGRSTSLSVSVGYWMNRNESHRGIQSPIVRHFVASCESPHWLQCIHIAHIFCSKPLEFKVGCLIPSVIFFLLVNKIPTALPATRLRCENETYVIKENGNVWIPAYILHSSYEAPK